MTVVYLAHTAGLLGRGGGEEGGEEEGGKLHGSVG